MTKTKYSQNEVDSVVDRLFEGAAASDLSALTGIPLNTIRKWQSAHESPTGEHLRAKQREAFVAVIDNYNQIRAVFGTIQAMDYSTKEVRGAQNSTTDRSHQVIDFQVDVTKAVEDTLNAEQLKFFNTVIKDKDLEDALMVQSVQFMHLQEKLGRVFIARQLFPVTKYFTVTKQ